MDLSSGTTKAFVKPNASTKYVSTSSSHPPVIIKSIPDSVSKRLSTISSSKELFLQEIPYYKAAMDRAGHREELTYKPADETLVPQKKKRNRDAIWFNPPWSSNVRTDIGA